MAYNELTSDIKMPLDSGNMTNVVIFVIVAK